MSLLKSFCSAFLMYSKIPVPKTAWKEENRRYALCFFPLVGVVVGGLIVGWYAVCERLGVHVLLFSVVAVAIPVFVTGGIHLDGFCDVVDAGSCWGTKEEMLKVMDDPHIGAFAAIHLGLYLLLQAGLFAQAQSFRVMLVCGVGFVQSRAWSGLGAALFKNAKGSGALWDFCRPAHRHVTVVVEILFLAVTGALMLLTAPVSGAAAMMAGTAAFVYYRIVSYRRFGGITGDLAGYFLQICELMIMAGAVAGGFWA